MQPFLRGHVFLCIPISIPQKRNNSEGINNKSNIIYYQNDSITNQHDMVYSSPLTLEKINSMTITQYYSVSLSSDSLFEELREGKYSYKLDHS